METRDLCMRINENIEGDLMVEIEPTETRALRAALAEVRFGFRLENFEVALGTTRDHAQILYERLDKLDLFQTNRIAVTPADFLVIKKAHDETLRELGLEEYHTRAGVDFAEGRALARQLDQWQLDRSR